MAFEVVHRHQRQVASQRHRLAERQPDHHPADQAGAGGGGDAGQVFEPDARLRHRLPGHRIDHLDMGAGGDLGGDAAERGVGLGLAAHHRRQHLGAAISQAHDRRGGVVAAGFNAEDGEAGGHTLFNWLAPSCSSRGN